MAMRSDDVTRLASPVAQTRAAAPADAEISGASRRLRALAALSGSLTDSLTPEDAADLVQRKALSALDATSAVVMTLGVFPPIPNPAEGPPSTPTTLTVVQAIGLPHDVETSLNGLSIHAPVPLAEVARIGVPLFLPSERDLERYPAWGAAMVRAGARAAAIVPGWANGELRGVLGLSWAKPRTFDEDERAFVLTLGVMCAQAIMRAHLRSAELRAREAAENANRSKTQFLSTISHELRTPMNAVLGYTDLLAQEIYGPVSDTQKAHLGRVTASGRHLLELIEELLVHARLEAGGEVVRTGDVVLGDIVAQSLVLVKPIADQKGLPIRVEGGAARIEMHTDARMVRQILINLLANAVKFTDTGHITLSQRLERRPEGDRVVIGVADTGRGIAPENRERVFDAYWQERPMSQLGSGLGLSVSRQLARLLGGDVVIASSIVGAGSTFVVTLPARFAPLPDTAESRAA